MSGLKMDLIDEINWSIYHSRLPEEDDDVYEADVESLSVEKSGANSPLPEIFISKAEVESPRPTRISQLIETEDQEEDDNYLTIPDEVSVKSFSSQEVLDEMSAAKKFEEKLQLKGESSKEVKTEKVSQKGSDNAIDMKAGSSSKSGEQTFNTKATEGKDKKGKEVVVGDETNENAVGSPAEPKDTIYTVGDEFLRRPESPPADHPASGKLVNADGEFVRMRTPPLEREQRDRQRRRSGTVVASTSATPLTSPQGKGKPTVATSTVGASTTPSKKDTPKKTEFQEEFKAVSQQIAKNGPRRSYSKNETPERPAARPRTFSMETVIAVLSSPEEKSRSRKAAPMSKSLPKPNIDHLMPWNQDSGKRMADFTLDPMLPSKSMDEWKDIRRNQNLPVDPTGSLYSFPHIEQGDDYYVKQYMSGTGLSGLREGFVAPIDVAIRIKNRRRGVSTSIGAVNNPDIDYDGTRKDKKAVTSPTARAYNSKDPEGWLATLDAKEAAMMFEETTGRDLAGTLMPLLASKKGGSPKSKESSPPAEQGVMASIGSALMSTITAPFKGKAVDNDQSSATSSNDSAIPKDAESLDDWIESQLPDRAGAHIDPMGAGGSISGRGRQPFGRLLKNPAFRYFLDVQTPFILERNPTATRPVVENIVQNLWEDIGNEKRALWASKFRSSGINASDSSDLYSSCSDMSEEEALERLAFMEEVTRQHMKDFYETFGQQVLRGGPELKILKASERYGNLESWNVLHLFGDDFVQMYLTRAGVQNAHMWKAYSAKWNVILNDVLKGKKKLQQQQPDKKENTRKVSGSSVPGPSTTSGPHGGGSKVAMAASKYEPSNIPIAGSSKAAAAGPFQKADPPARSKK